MKQKRNKMMLLLPCAVIATVVGTFVYFACSDDEWEGSPEYLHTYASQQTRAGVEGEEEDNGYHRYPSYQEILNSTIVKNAMNSAWNDTESFAQTEGCREIGFYIYYNPTRGYYIGERKYGNVITTCEDTIICVNLGEPENAEDMCAFYHTHPTLQYIQGNGYREHGASDADRVFASVVKKIPGFIDDYTDSKLYYGVAPFGSRYTYWCGPKRRRNE